MNKGDFVLMAPDANGIVRHQTIDGAEAFAQRMANRLLAIRGESPFDATLGLPLMNMAEMQNASLFASVAAGTVKNDSDVESVRNVVFAPQTDAQFQNGEVDVIVTIARKDGSVVAVQTTV